MQILTVAYLAEARVLYVINITPGRPVHLNISSIPVHIHTLYRVQQLSNQWKHLQNDHKITLSILK